ncbi:MAG: TetR/AcrR family transcriptional regulator [Oscillospiraceae bacterium]
MKVNNNDFWEKLHNETLLLIVEHGAKGWTVNTICKNVGIAKDTFYRIIGTKENLVKRVILQEIDLHLSKITLIIGNHDVFFEKLKAIIESLSTFFIKLPSNKLREVMIEYPSIEKSVNMSLADSVTSIENFIDMGKELGEILKTVDSQLIVKVLHLCMIEFITTDDACNAESDIEKLLSYLIYGVKQR